MNCAVIIKRIILFSVVLFFIDNNCLTQSSYRFENIANEQGIADRVINAVTQDKQGFIWIASYDGLTKYDGYKALVYRHISNDPHSLSDNEVYALGTDGNGVLWIGTRNGLNRYDEQHDRFETFFHDSADENSLSANEIFSLARDKYGNIWIGTYSGGLDKLINTEMGKGYRGSGYIFEHCRHVKNDSSSISDNQVLSLCFDSAGNGWVGTEKGLNVMNSEKKSFRRFYADKPGANSISSNSVAKVVAAPDGAVWICGKNMLDKIVLPGNSSGSISVKHMLPVLTENKNNFDWSVNDFMIDRDHNCWVATNEEGVFKIANIEDPLTCYKENYTNDASEYSLANTTAYSLYEDRSGIIWIGTAKGVSQYIPSNARFNQPGVFSPGSFLNEPVTALLADHKNRLWTGGYSDTLNIIEHGSNSSVRLPFLKSNYSQVNNLFQTSVGDICIATFNAGLFIIPNSLENVHNTTKWLHINKANSPLSSNNIYSLVEDKNKCLWLGTYLGLNCYDLRTGELKNIYTSPQGSIVSAFITRILFVDDKNIVWAGTDDGLLLIKDHKVIRRFFSDDEDTSSLSNDRITVIYGDSRKNIWVGTKSGLNLFDPVKNNFKHIKPADDVVIETIMSIKEDVAGNLWIGTSSGLVKFNVVKNSFTKYTVEDGLCSNEFSANAASGDTRRNFLYFGTTSGIVSFNPTHIVSNNFIPPVVITGIKILDKPLASFTDTALINTYRREKKLLLKYNQNFFSFEFAALSYNNSKANQYRYILEGIDKQWRNSGTQYFAGYTDIRPGHYIFKVKASNNDGIWNNEPAIVKVIIMPPWWQTWWFYALCILTAVGFIYMIYRIRIQQVLKLYRLRSSIAKDLHDDVGSALSSIALLSNISEKARAKASLQPEEVFTRIGDTSKRMIDLMDDIVWSVNPDNDRFSNMLVRMREYAAEMLEPKDIELSFHTADMDELRIPMQMRKDYFLIYKEAINNLVKYAECDAAFISIKKENRTIITIIKDDGKGFDAAIIHSGNGLKNMQQRAAAIKSKLIIETMNGNGTTITLLMPV